MGDSNYYADGQWNFTCDLCGKKAKSGDAMKTWDNFYVCRHHKEARNPQDFLRGVKDNQTVPWSRPDPGPVYGPPGLLTQEDGFLLTQETGGWGFYLADYVSPESEL